MKTLCPDELTGTPSVELHRHGHDGEIWDTFMLTRSSDDSNGMWGVKLSCDIARENRTLTAR